MLRAQAAAMALDHGPQPPESPMPWAPKQYGHPPGSNGIGTKASKATSPHFYRTRHGTPKRKR